MQGNFFLKKRIQSSIILAVLLLVTYGAMTLTEFSLADGLESIPAAIQWGFSNFYPTAESLENLPSILEKIVETLLISIASATTASVFAVFFAIAGSKTTKVNGFFAVISRGIATLFRNIDVAAWAMILLFSFGQSSLTGYFALFFVSFGFLTRAFMETIDEVGAGAVEALQATGAGYFTVIVHSVIPSSIPQMISWSLFMVETNIRSATLVGILTGTGIGFSFDLYYKSLNYNSASLVVITIVVSILLIEIISNYVRRVIL
ncbi:phosphate/phosphonate ABC transporter permease [Bacillus canaveralius]|uniref:phosphate/phosphonate ABC transporter permease n=1 Tax=Bacillus canaveralius TaxID=1403243 RepID=UPI000F7A8A1A|nr:phosphate/phosphonate ABC transporter permease [Bacillus canaveralius]RSK55187.1 phosphate/phosphonate ABC transporter permease [Bacillus canaveralius]